MPGVDNPEDEPDGRHGWCRSPKRTGRATGKGEQKKSERGHGRRKANETCCGRVLGFWNSQPEDGQSEQQPGQGRLSGGQETPRYSAVPVFGGGSGSAAGDE